MIALRIPTIVFSIFIAVKFALGASLIKRDNPCSNFEASEATWPSVNDPGVFLMNARYDSTGVDVPLGLAFFGNIDLTFLAPALTSGETIGTTVGPYLGNYFQIIDSGLIGIGYDESEWLSNYPIDSNPFQFSRAINGNLTDGLSEEYCMVFSTDPNGSLYPGPLLAGGGTVDAWSICNGTADISQEQAIILGASTEVVGVGFYYNYTTCEPVHIWMEV